MEPPCIGHCRENPPGSITIFTCKAGGSAGGTSIGSMRTDCFGIPGCSRVFWMSFPQENANSTLNKTNSHDAFMFMTNFLEKLLVSTIIGQALYTTTDLWFLVLCLKGLNSILDSFEALFSYHWGYTHARSCKFEIFSLKFWGDTHVRSCKLAIFCFRSRKICHFPVLSENRKKCKAGDFSLSLQDILIFARLVIFRSSFSCLQNLRELCRTQDLRFLVLQVAFFRGSLSQQLHCKHKYTQELTHHLC